MGEIELEGKDKLFFFANGQTLQKYLLSKLICSTDLENSLT